MKKDLLQRIPRIPHWRWVLTQGSSHPDWSEPMAQLARFISEEKIDVGLGMVSEPTGEVERAIKIWEHEAPIARTIEAMLYERCGPTLISEALFHKFKEPISIDVVKCYRKLFYDTEILNNYDIAKYYELTAQKIPNSPPVPGHMKEDYIAFKNGVDSTLDIQKAMMHMFQTSFYRAQELTKFGWPADDKVIKFQKNALDIIKTLQDGELDIDIPDEFNYTVEYPSATAIGLEAIEGYDPTDDPNKDETEEDG